MKTCQEKKLKDNLNGLLLEIKKDYDENKQFLKITNEEIISLNVNYFICRGTLIVHLKRIESLPIGSMEFVKNLLQIEELFQELSKSDITIKKYYFPKFRQIVEIDILIYAKIEREIDKLEDKSMNLCNRGYIDAYNSSKTIVNLLKELNRSYFLHNNMYYKTYKEEAFDIINKYRNELDKHRGYKEILGNLLLLITTLGTAHLVKLATTGSLLFFNKTNSSQKVDALLNTIESSEINFPSMSNG